MRKNERILVVLNPAAGVVSKDAAASIIFKKLREHFNTVSLINSNSPSHGYEITRQAIDRFDIITAFGGDGTINSIASALVNSGKTLGILPGGSGNGLARNLGIPLSWKRALDVLIYGNDPVMDAGKINDRFFLNIAGVGLDGLIAKSFNQGTKRRGVFSYIYHSGKVYLKAPTYRVQIKWGDTIFQEEILTLAFANSRQYGSRAIIAPFASPFDRLLDICIINEFKRLKELRHLPRLFNGTIHQLHFYKTFKFDRVEITSLDGAIPFHFDGEYGGEDSSVYRIDVLPACIKIRIPSPEIEHK